jgi:hypothetical protein
MLGRRSTRRKRDAMNAIQNAAHEYATARVRQYIAKFGGRPVLARAADDNVYQHAYSRYIARSS